MIDRLIDLLIVLMLSSKLMSPMSNKAENFQANKLD